ncbi:MAG: DUF167 domain-containing protein [Spirochaetaceae bacterium]|jgi:uncharacterized protein (TIGR00251 family)|nr:DUF167 domain-containing protein [Spirochaetaceae bacterium]
MPPCLEVRADRVFLYIKAVPGAPKSQIAEVREGRLRVKIAAPPEDGKANAELRAFFAELLGCPKKSAILHAGLKSRLKTLSFPLSLQAKLENLINPCS